MSLASVVVLNGSGLDEVFKAGKASGQIRAAHIANGYDAGGNDYATALGGELKYETAPWNNLKLGIAAYISQKVGFATGENTLTNGDIFDENKNSYTYIGEAYFDYSANDFSLRVGRQRINTPLADTNDIRINPNTFEAAIATYNGIKGTMVQGGYVIRWAGHDSGNDKSTFKKLAGPDSNGAVVIGALNESIENLAVQWWYYRIDRVADVLYTDATYTLAFNETADIELIAQYITFNEDKASMVDGHVYGVGIAMNGGILTLGAAYNRTLNDDGKVSVNGFGNGPYFTSMQEWSIGNMEDAKAYQFNSGLNMGFLGVEELTLNTLYGVFKSSPLDAKVKEVNLMSTYKMSEVMILDATYAKIINCNNNVEGGTDNGYSRFLTRINYKF